MEAIPHSAMGERLRDIISPRSPVNDSLRRWKYLEDKPSDGRRAAILSEHWVDGNLVE